MAQSSGTRVCTYLCHTPRIISEVFEERAYRVVTLKVPLQEAPAISDPTIRTINACEVFQPGTVFFGVGLPNVFLGVVTSENEMIKLDAKSMHRAPTTLTTTSGKMQSGVFLVPTNLPACAIDRVRAAAFDLAQCGATSPTCVRANMSVLAQCGFTLGDGATLDRYLFPHNFLRDVLHKGILYQGNEIKFDLVRTTTLALGDFMDRLASAVHATPLRHWVKSHDDASARQRRIEQATSIEEANRRLLENDMFRAKQEEMNGRDGIVTEPRCFVLSASHTSGMGYWLRRLWGEHTIYRIDVTPALVDALLPTRLKEFPQPHPSLATRVKKTLLFSNRVVRWIRNWMAPSFDELGAFNERDVLDMMLPPVMSSGQSTALRPVKYNIVVTGTSVYICKLNVRFALIDWCLCKHLVISNYSQDVRFAGECARGTDRLVVRLNKNSGSYQPNDTQLASAVQLAHKLFAHLEIRPDLPDN